MKTISNLALSLIISSLFYCISCKKPSVDAKPKEQLILGKWSINKIRISLVNNGVVLKDSTVPNTPQPENYVTFKADGSLEYKLNSTVTNTGTYHFVGTDSVYATIGTTLYKWKNLLLTDEIFNVQNTQTFPQFPGSTVETYQTFVK